MLNIIILMGRLVEQPTLSTKIKEEKEIKWTKYRLAVNRDFKIKGQPSADFFDCISFGGNAEYLTQYGKKGTKILIQGKSQVYPSTKSGSLRNIHQVLAECVKIWVNDEKTEKEIEPVRIFSPVQDYLNDEVFETYEGYELPMEY